MDWDKQVTVTKVTKYKGEVSMEMLRKAFGIPHGAAVSVHVPGGGDWSNCELDLDHYGPIYVEWSEQGVDEGHD